MDNTRAEQLRAALDEIPTSKTTRPKDLVTSRKYLADNPKYSHPANPVEIDEVKTRVDILQDVQKSIRMIQPDWRATAIHLAIFMVMPMDHLDKWKGLFEYTDPESWVKGLESCIKWFGLWDSVMFSLLYFSHLSLFTSMKEYDKLP